MSREIETVGVIMLSCTMYQRDVPTNHFCTDS